MGLLFGPESTDAAMASARAQSSKVLEGAIQRKIVKDARERWGLGMLLHPGVPRRRFILQEERQSNMAELTHETARRAHSWTLHP